MPDPRDNYDPKPKKYDPVAMEQKLQRAIKMGIMSKKLKAAQKKYGKVDQVKIARRLGA